MSSQAPQPSLAFPALRYLRRDHTQTKEGQNKYKKMRSMAFVPYVGIPALLVHPEQAEIKPDMTLTAQVGADTRVQPEQ